MGDKDSIGGIAFDYNNYNGYPTNDFVFWIGHLTMHYNPALSNHAADVVELPETGGRLEPDRYPGDRQQRQPLPGRNGDFHRL